MTSPADGTMDIDSGDNHTQHASREPKAERPFDATIFNSDVCNAIEEQMKVPGAQISPFQDPEALQNDDSAILFNIILKACLGESPMTVEMCKGVLLCCGDLKSALNKAYVNKSFNDILLHPNMPLQVLERVPKKEPTISPSSSGGIKDDQVLGVKAGFERPYIGNAAKRFIRTLNREREAFGRNTAVNNPYNFAISVVQSSGTGKSRMVQEAAKTVFTIPINIRQESKVAERAYPPPDRSLRGFFEDRVNYDDDQQKADYMVLLTVIFDKTQQIIRQLFRGSTGAALAHQWARYLGTDETDIEVGKLRKDFYDDVVKTATHICRHSVPNLVKLELSLQTSCKRLVATVQPVLDNTNTCFMYFDEAHLLTQEIETPSETHQRNPFHNLGNVLSKLVNYRIFFIFLSTNSSLKGFAPPASYYTSQRSIDGSQLVAPYIELPFDINAVTPVDAEHPPTLESASKVGHMVQYGRALQMDLHVADLSGRRYLSLCNG
ncbi:unnamed protein product [Rhizoctonia solani]|uniref:Uncharacterized protein n=1 Tax=Rhizoctonia solani TaxID=456999 RepID=A0A8H3D6J7_9AGAM|nr:unnamed protein product [Rhizoctonia solani]